MKTAFAAAMALLIACLLAGNALAQEKSNFQSVGGDYGRNVLSNIGASDAETASKSESNQSLWNWGGAPKGSLIVDGNIIGDPRYTLKNLSVMRDWLGDSFVDPYGDTPAYSYFDPVTGERVKTYVDPITGQHYYTYTDSNSGKLVYVYFNPRLASRYMPASLPYPASTSKKNNTHCHQYSHKIDKMTCESLLSSGINLSTVGSV